MKIVIGLIFIFIGGFILFRLIEMFVASIEGGHGIDIDEDS